MAMKLVKKTAEYKIFRRGDERYAVQDAAGKAVNGEEKVRILLAEELITATLPAAPVEEAPAEEAEAADEAPAAEDAAEEAPVAEDAAEEPAAEAEAEEEAQG